MYLLGGKNRKRERERRQKEEEGASARRQMGKRVKVTADAAATTVSHSQTGGTSTTNRQSFIRLAMPRQKTSGGKQTNRQQQIATRWMLLLMQTNWLRGQSLQWTVEWQLLAIPKLHCTAPSVSSPVSTQSRPFAFMTLSSSFSQPHPLSSVTLYVEAAATVAITLTKLPGSRCPWNRSSDDYHWLS